MTLDQSVLSELLDAFRTGEGLDLIKEAAALVCIGGDGDGRGSTSDRRTGDRKATGSIALGRAARGWPSPDPPLGLRVAYCEL